MRFFFDIDDGEHKMSDAHGFELEDREAARKEAIGILPNLARDILPDGNEHVFTAVVRDEHRPIFQAKLVLLAKWLDK